MSTDKDKTDGVAVYVAVMPLEHYRMLLDGYYRDLWHRLPTMTKEAADETFRKYNAGNQKVTLEWRYG